MKTLRYEQKDGTSSGYFYSIPNTVPAGTRVEVLDRNVKAEKHASQYCYDVRLPSGRVITVDETDLC